MEEWAKLAIEVAIPVVATVVGYIVTLARLRDRQQEQAKSIGMHASAIAELKKENAGAIAELRKELLGRCEKIEERLDDLPQGFKLEINTHRDDLEGSIDDLREDIEKLRDKIDRIRDSNSDFAKEAELAKLVFEVNSRFETILRAIGKLEGTIYDDRRRDR